MATTTPAPAAAAAANNKAKALFVITLAHNPIHPLVGFTGLNGKMYFAALNVCQLLNARHPEALAEHIAPCQMKNVTPFSGRHWMRRDAWVVEYHGLLYFLTTALLDKARSTFQEAPARQLLQFLKHGVVSSLSNRSDEGIHYLKESRSIPFFWSRRKATADTFSSTDSPTTTHNSPNHLVAADNPRQVISIDAADDDDEPIEQPAAAAAADEEEGCAAPAPSSFCMPFVLWKFEQQSQMVYQGL